MEFEILQTIRGPLTDVDAAFADRDFLESLDALPRIAEVAVLDQSRDGDLVTQRVRYRFDGDLSAAVRRVVDPARLSWVEESRHDLRAHTAEHRIVPDHYREMLRGAYRARLERDGRARVRRTIDGELRVRVPLLGARVERVIVDGLRENAVAQQDLLADWLSRP